MTWEEGREEEGERGKGKKEDGEKKKEGGRGAGTCRKCERKKRRVRWSEGEAGEGQIVKEREEGERGR